MAKRYVHNDTSGVKFVGGVLIPPGEGREVDEQFLPPVDSQLAAAVDGAGTSIDAGTGTGAGVDTTLPPDEAALRANLAELLAQPLKALLPTLDTASDDTLGALQAMEQASATPRVTLLNAIGALLLKRAQARTEQAGDQGPDGTGDSARTGDGTGTGDSTGTTTDDSTGTGDGTGA